MFTATHTRYLTALSEAGLTVDRGSLMSMNEANQIKVADGVLTQMMKFITDKYNAIDFDEIEKSAGSIDRFKYKDLILENLKMLVNIYSSSTDPGASKYLEVVQACINIMDFLRDWETDISALYKSGNGLIQLLYTSLVSSVVYAVGTLVSNTIQFVTIEQETDCQVLFDEIPGSIRHVHIKNVLSANKDLDTIEKLIRELNAQNKKKATNESVGAIAAVTVGLVILLAPRIILLIREIIYSIYFSRVKVADMLKLQAQLVQTNIESLESGRGNKTIIARQKRIVEQLNKWQKRIAIKMDTVEVATKSRIDQENRVMHVSKDNEFVQQALEDADTSILI